MTPRLLAAALLAAACTDRTTALPLVADETNDPNLAATIYSASCNAPNRSDIEGSVYITCGTDYRGNRAVHEYDIELRDDSNRFTPPSAHVRQEGIGEFNGFLRYWFYSQVNIREPRNCSIELNGNVLHQASWDLGAPSGAFGYDSRIVYVWQPSTPCRDPCKDGSGGGGSHATPLSCSGGGGGGNLNCHTEWVEIDISYDGGNTWNPWWHGWVNVCGGGGDDPSLWPNY